MPQREARDPSRRTAGLASGPRLTRAVLVVLVALAAIPGARAQDLEPRAFANLPVDISFLATGYGFQRGDVATDPSAPLQNAKLTVEATFLGYAHAFSVLGQTAKLDAVLPYGWISGSADVAGEPVRRTVDGLGDPAVRLAYNFYGSPALSLKDFPSYEEDLLAGVSVRLSAPLGQYQSGKLVNVGTHRWSVKPEIGVVKAWGPIKLELASGVSIFSSNPDYLGNHHRDQAPIFSQQGHLVWRIWRGILATADATYYTGGRATVDGVEGASDLANGRVGGTLTIPASFAVSFKLHGSTGVSTRFGTSFDTVGIGILYRLPDAPE